MINSSGKFAKQVELVQKSVIWRRPRSLDASLSTKPFFLDPP